MGLFKNLGQKVKNTGTLLQPLLQSYLAFKPSAKQLIFKQKTVNFLCQQAQVKIEQITSLKPDEEKGLIAVIKHQDISAKIHFTPESITIKENWIEGKLKILDQPEINSDSRLYNYLIGGWQIFLGGKVPNFVLHENIKVENNYIYYTFPRGEIKLLEVLLKTVENDSNLKTNLQKGELIIETSVIINWQEINLKDLISILKIDSN
jgi:hypothetical protein